jgi:hypothetical protein
MLQTADFDLADFEDPNAKRNKDFVRFFMQPVKNEEKSKLEGRPIYEDREYVEIMVPGNDTNRPVLRVTEIERNRYPIQYAKWKASGQAESVLEGTHLVNVPWLTRAQVEELVYFRIRTLEQLAVVSDSDCQRIVGLLELRRKAQAQLAAAKDSSLVHRLNAELEERDSKITALETALAEQGKIIKALQERIEE